MQTLKTILVASALIAGAGSFALAQSATGGARSQHPE